MIEILLTPDTRGRHGVDQIRAREQCDPNRLPGSISGLNPSTNDVDLVVEMIQDHGRGLIFLLHRLPSIYHQPIRSLIDCQLAHCDTGVIRSVSQGGGGKLKHSRPYRCSALARPALRYASDTGDRYPPSNSKSVLNLT